MDERNPFAVALGLEIVRLRAEQGISRYRLSQDSGVSEQLLSFYERGISIPGFDKLEKIRKALGVEAINV